MAIRWPWKRKKKDRSRRGAVSLESYARGYAAAKNHRLYSDWATYTASANEEIKAALKIMRHRSRELSRNNDYAKRFLSMVKSNVIGKDGIVMHPRAINSDGRMDEPANRLISEAWAEWGRRGTCTVDGRLSWIDAQRLFIESVAKDGECLVKKYHDWSKNRFRFAIQFIDPAMLETQFEEIRPNGNRVRMSVELDKYGRPVAYHLLNYDPDDNAISGNIITTRERIPADLICHAFSTDFPGQARGVPWMHTAGKRLHMLDGYEEAELVAARTAAAKMGFFTSKTGDEYVGDDDDTEDGRNAAPISDASPGTMEQLPDGMGFQPWDPQHPTTAFPEFEKALLRGIASGLGVTYVGLANNLQGVNLSSIRQGSLDEQEFWRELQNWSIGALHQDVFDAWLLRSITVGAIRLPIAKIGKFRKVKWQPRRWKRVDPLKEASGNELSVKMGSKSLQDVAGERGRDLETVLQENAAAVDIAKKYGMENLVNAIFGGNESTTTKAAKEAEKARMHNEKED
jgi:lambda family phage portal protein